MKWDLDTWTVLRAEHFNLLSRYIRSATDRGIYYKDQRLVQCFKKFLNNRQCLLKTEHDTLLLARHFKYINNKIFKLMIPPIHLHGDEQIELQALLQCLSEGISSNVTKEYAQMNDLKFSTISENEGAREVMYERGMDLGGKRYQNIRHERRRFLKRIEQGEIELILDYPYEKLLPLNEAWVRQKGRDYGEYGYVIKNIDIFKDHVRNATLVSDGKPIASQLYVTFNEHTWYCSSSISDYDSSYSHGAQRQLYINIFDFVENLQRVLPGGWTKGGLKSAKKSIPHQILTKVRAKPYTKLGADYWQRIELLKGKPAKKPKKSKKDPPAPFFDV